MSSLHILNLCKWLLSAIWWKFRKLLVIYTKNKSQWRHWKVFENFQWSLLVNRALLETSHQSFLVVSVVNEINENDKSSASLIAKMTSHFGYCWLHLSTWSKVFLPNWSCRGQEYPDGVSWWLQWTHRVTGNISCSAHFSQKCLQTPPPRLSLLLPEMPQNPVRKPPVLLALYNFKLSQTSKSLQNTQDMSVWKLCKILVLLPHFLISSIDPYIFGHWLVWKALAQKNYSSPDILAIACCQNMSMFFWWGPYHLTLNLILSEWILTLQLMTYCVCAFLRGNSGGSA